MSANLIDFPPGRKKRTLRERRGLQEALAAILAKYDRAPPNNERDVLGRMIEVLKAEIAFRNAGQWR
jgi:hypothetical protein